MKRLNVRELSTFGAAVLAGSAARLIDEAKVRVWKAAVRSVIENAALR